ncbi:MAG: hypothetical protein WA738_08305 [Candidatus Angelobacter sp.]
MKSLFAFVLGCALLVGFVGCGGGSSTPAPTPTPVNPATVTPAAATVPVGGTQLFTATNFSGTVLWSINPQVGTIDANGIYHAPASFPSPNNLTVTASASGVSSTATATVEFPNHNGDAQSAPILLGSSGANIADVGSRVCCIGTLGSLWNRGSAAVILSNNHVLARSDQGVIGEAIQQPGQAACFSSNINVANLTAKAALTPAGTTQGRTGPSPSNTDSAVATVIPGQVDAAGTILDLGPAGASSIAAAPPSSTIGMASVGLAVAKSGRTTGLTCSTINSINANIVVGYETACGSNITNFNAIYANQVVISGGSFSGSGDSGSLVVTQAESRPVALLYGGSTTDTVANPIQDVIAALTLTPIAGNPDHAVSCQPTVSNGLQVNGQSATVGLSSAERQRVTAVQQRRAANLMQDSAVKAVEVGASADNPKEGALVIHVAQPLSAPVPQMIDGVRTRLVVQDGSGVQLPEVGQVQIDHATAVKDAHVADLMSQPGIQGVGVSISADNPTETAVSIYVIKGVAHPAIPAVLDGIRTRIFEGDRFKAY